jgi:tetratricopeptide (TPR) repeat protein
MLTDGMKRGVAVLLLSVIPAVACLWDRDTLKEEAAGKLDTVKAITGWFDRYPSRYYEMRLQRVTKELAEKPDALELYDDAGVACDRLGRYDEAIRWMEKKKVRLDAKPGEQTSEHRYRYLANLGSFLGNRWATRPAQSRNNDPKDLFAAVGYIDQAIQLNPEAHFGREKYQLMLFRWLADGFNVDLPAAEHCLADQLGNRWGQGALAASGLGDAEQGLVGLIHLGSAWESVDVFDALGTVVETDGAGSIGVLVSLRMKELSAAGRRTLYTRVEHRPGSHGHTVEDWAPLELWYAVARKASEARKEAWVAYQEERFAKGLHPDTHPGFWNEWKEPLFPEFPDLGKKGNGGGRKVR